MSTSGGGDNEPGGLDLPNHYEVLGLNEQATATDVKRAYYRLVREFRPADHPEDFQQFNDASATLTDPRRRAAYDQSRRNGRRVQVLVDQAARTLDADPHKAIALLKNAIALAPDVPRPRMLLAHVLVRIDEFAAAERQYRWLQRDNPRDETLLFKLARTVWQQGRIDDAEQELLGVLAINPRLHDALMLAARLYEDKGRYRQAAEMLERAIANDGRENFVDLDALIRLLALYYSTENHEEAERAGRRILAVIPGEDPVRAEKGARRILQRAADFFQTENYVMCQRILPIAIQAAQPFPEILAIATDLGRATLLKYEARQIEADTLIRSALKPYLVLRYLEKAPDSGRQQIDVLLVQLQSEIAIDPRSMCVHIDYMRSEYPTIAAEQERLFRELYDRAQRRMASARRGDTMAMPEKEIDAVINGADRRKRFGWFRGGGSAA
jgi:curved DNA-binding protein CbpA